MIRRGTRLFFALVAAALAALLLTACGGSDSSNSGSESTAAEASTQNGGSQSSGGGQSNGSAESRPQERQKNKGGDGDKHFTKAEVSVPLKVSGGGSDQFIIKEGDNSIQEFGEELSESELEEAAMAVHDFYVARAVGAWADACSRMSRILREQLEQLASKSNVKGCAPFLEAFTSPLPAATWREVTTVNAASLRREDDHGFLIYTGANEIVYAMPLKEEEGEWKVTGLFATELIGV